MLASTLVLAACTEQSADDLGPVAAVSRETDDSMEAGIEGVLAITANCVVLRGGDGSEVLLIFRESEVEWDAEAGEIVFEGERGTERLRHGQEVMLGGGGSSAAEDGVDTRTYVEDVDDWVNPPDPECWRDRRFEVHGGA